MKRRAAKKTYEVECDIPVKENYPAAQRASLDEPSVAEVRAVARRYGLTAELVKLVGPGGGNSNWRFRGPASGIKSFVRKWYAKGDPHMAEEQLDIASDVPKDQLDASFLT